MEIDIAIAALRVIVGVTMIAHGINHWRGGGKIAGTAGWFSSLGLRHGKFQAWMSVLTEIGAGAFLLLGLLTPFAAAGLISISLVAGLLVHRKNGFFIVKEGYEYILVLAVVNAAIALTGPGKLSLDHALGIDETLSGWGGLGIAVGVAVLATAALLAATYRPKKA